MDDTATGMAVPASIPYIVGALDGWKFEIDILDNGVKLFTDHLD